MFEKLKNLEPFRPRCPGITNNGDEHICPGVFPGDDTQVGDEDGLHGDSLVDPGLGEAEVEAEVEAEQEHQEVADLTAPELEGAVSLVNPLHPYHLRPRSRAPTHRPGEVGAQVSDQAGAQGVTEAEHQQHDLTQAVEGARRLRPRKVIKYTYVTTNKQLRFGSNVSVREYEKKSPVRTCLGQVEQYPCTLDGFHVDIEHYIPSRLQFDPTLSRREVMLILCKNINT